LEGRADREVYLKADKDISYGTVVRVMAEIKGAGVEKLGMVTEPSDFDKENKKSKSKK
jgi:biopolymer transport protein TolR